MKLISNERGLVFGAFLLAMLVASPAIIKIASSDKITEQVKTDKEKVNKKTKCKCENKEIEK
jgi:hypothetical protein